MKVTKELIILSPPHFRKDAHTIMPLKQKVITRVKAMGGQKIWRLEVATGEVTEFEFEKGQTKAKMVFDPAYLFAPAVNPENVSRKFANVIIKYKLDARQEEAG